MRICILTAYALIQYAVALCSILLSYGQRITIALFPPHSSPFYGPEKNVELLHSTMVTLGAVFHGDGIGRESIHLWGLIWGVLSLWGGWNQYYSPSIL